MFNSFKSVTSKFNLNLPVLRPPPLPPPTVLAVYIEGMPCEHLRSLMAQADDSRLSHAVVFRVTSRDPGEVLVLGAWGRKAVALARSLVSVASARSGTALPSSGCVPQDVVRWVDTLVDANYELVVEVRFTAVFFLFDTFFSFFPFFLLGKHRTLALRETHSEPLPRAQTTRARRPHDSTKQHT